MKRVLILSAGSPCRAIIAETILNNYIDKNLDIEFIGAGLEAASEINQSAMKLLVLEGVDIEKLEPKILSDVEDEDFDLVLTMCCHSKEICPKFPKKVPTLHMEFPIILDEDEASCRELAIRVKTKVKPVIIQELF